jgi:hypothetical protein
MLTSVVFNQTANIFGMVNATVVQYNDAARARIRVGERELMWRRSAKDKVKTKESLPQVHEGIGESEQR